MIGLSLSHEFPKHFSLVMVASKIFIGISIFFFFFLCFCMRRILCFLQPILKCVRQLWMKAEIRKLPIFNYAILDSFSFDSLSKITDFFFCFSFLLRPMRSYRHTN